MRVTSIPILSVCLLSATHLASVESVRAARTEETCVARMASFSDLARATPAPASLTSDEKKAKQSLIKHLNQRTLDRLFIPYSERNFPLFSLLEKDPELAARLLGALASQSASHESRHPGPHIGMLFAEHLLPREIKKLTSRGFSVADARKTLQQLVHDLSLPAEEVKSSFFHPLDRALPRSSDGAARYLSIVLPVLARSLEPGDLQTLRELLSAPCTQAQTHFCRLLSSLRTLHAEVWLERLKGDLGFPQELRYQGRPYSFTNDIDIDLSKSVEGSEDFGTHWRLVLRSGQQSVEVPLGDQKLRITRDLNSLRAGQALGKTVSPHYGALAEDGKIRGLIWADRGFESESTETLNEYVSFYESRGFHFKSEAVEDFQEFLGREISNGSLDYMVREGHMEKTLEAYNRGRLKIGRKSGDSAPYNEVVIFFPRTGDSPVKIPWDNVSDWMKVRNERSQALPFYYFDTKCHGAQRICEFNRQVDSPHFTIIAADEMATTLTNDTASPLRAILGAFLDRQGYATMEQAMEAARAKSAQAQGIHPDSFTDDAYLLPHQPSYPADKPKDDKLYRVGIQLLDARGREIRGDLY